MPMHGAWPAMMSWRKRTMNDDSGSTFQRNFERQVKIPSRPFSSFLNKVSLLLAWLSLLVLNKNQAKTKTKKREGCFVTICSGFREISINYYHLKEKEGSSCFCLFLCLKTFAE